LNLSHYISVLVLIELREVIAVFNKEQIKLILRIVNYISEHKKCGIKLVHSFFDVFDFGEVLTQLLP